MKKIYNKTVIFLGGKFEQTSFVEKLIDENTFLIGADSGSDHIYRLGLKPHAVIGDFDSVQNFPETIKNLLPEKDGTLREIDDITYIKYPTDKDYLDGELAIDFALSHGPSKIILVGNLSQQTDYVMGNIFLLGKREYAGKDIRIVQENLEIFVASGETKLAGRLGQKISLIPLFGKVIVTRSSGLKYDLAKYEMSLATNSGIGNIFTAPEATLTIKSGKILVIKPYE